ncbi:mechanosensitive ion channel domain-containing protein [Bacteriovorax sp. DB6_IX]|uniref:mechanosensitive ion channel domain-containing protein n=1 Tax=Bacteriovorax sp. DB6_IX TaxID=1353530 RepID=UPI000389FE02|nr:mechanosensitive ion channel domain-containing protein [Bacteriovorax sp. DB6_IX]EQC51153.1 transporter, small conductance mechanosensitive ion channel MscS family protein [Bacteriovorax sp. DB6_IX]
MEALVAKALDLFAKYPYLKTVVFTFLLFVFYLVIRKVALKAISKGPGSKVEKQLIQKKFSKYSLYFLVLCIFFLWFTQLQVFFVSILAVAAAIVLAFKEMIMCITGGLLVNISNTFKTGDRIEVDGYRGFVIEKSLLTTKILEIGPEKNSQQTTGDIISIPNSLMLSKGLKNESYFKGYSIKSFVFKIENQSLVTSFEKAILAEGEKFCQSYLEDAKKNINNFCDKERLIVPSVNPKSKVLVDEGKDFSVLIKIPLKNTEIADAEQLFNRFYLNWKVKNADKLKQS